jgi:hypothetical protein
MALLLTSAGVTGVIVAIVEFISAYRGFSYMGNGYWWKKAISWKKTVISLAVIFIVLIFGVISIIYLVQEA